NWLATLGAFVLGFGQVFFLANIVWTFVKGPVSDPDPWGEIPAQMHEPRVPASRCTRCRSTRWRTAGRLKGLASQGNRLELPEDLLGEPRSRVVVAALEGGARLLQHLPDLAHVPPQVAGLLRGLEGAGHPLQGVRSGHLRAGLVVLLLEDLIPEGFRGPARRGRRGDWRLRSPRLGRRRRGRGFHLDLRRRLDFYAARLEGGGQALRGLAEALLLPREPFPLGREPDQLLAEGLLQFDEGFVLGGGLLLAGVHLLADLQHLPLPALVRIEPFVLKVDQL